jgi:hypothetical protein
MDHLDIKSKMSKAALQKFGTISVSMIGIKECPT